MKKSKEEKLLLGLMAVLHDLKMEKYVNPYSGEEYYAICFGDDIEKEIAEIFKEKI